MLVAVDRWTEFGKWLRERRDLLRITQPEAARRAELTKQHWSRLELGESGTKRETIPMIAHALGTNLAETYERAGFLPDDPDPATLAGHSDNRSNLTPDQNALVDNLIDELRRGNQN